MADPKENSLFDIPDYEHTEDETFAAFPPPASPGDGDGGQIANGMDDWDGNRGSPQAEEPQQPARKKVKRNIPKLDADRLVSERGLPALRTMFNDTKFKGKGHEAEDLKLLLRHMEHWAHRLYPKLAFEDFINKLEALGSKKPVQTCLKRIRMDLPLVHNDFTSQEGVEMEGQSNGVNMPSEDFDMHLPSKAIEPSPGHLSVKASSPTSSQFSPSLSEELRLRIERNKQLALERRMAKIQNSSQSQDLSPSPMIAPPVAEVKMKDRQELYDDMNDEFLDVLVAAAAETEASVMDSATALVDDGNAAALEVANLSTAKANTVKMAAANIAAEMTANASRKEAAETALVEDAAELPVMEDAPDTMVDIDKSEDETVFSTKMTLAEISGDTSVSDKDRSMANVFEESVHKVPADSETRAAKVAPEAATEQDTADSGTSETNYDFAADGTVSVSAIFTVDNTESAGKSADGSILSAALDSAVDDSSNEAVVKGPTEINPAFRDEATATAASSIHDKEAISAYPCIGTPGQNL